MLFAFCGCVTTAFFPEQTRLECPEPVVRCEPGRFDQITIDTSSAPQIRSRNYLSITKVEGLETEADEFGVSFPATGGTGAHGRVTIRRARRSGVPDELVPVRFASITKASTGTPFRSDEITGSIGRGAIREQSSAVAFAAHREGGVRGDYDLYTGHERGTEIADAERNPISAVVWWDAQPALSPDGRSLYFASDRPGGLGGTDLYRSDLAPDGSWSEPVNLGAGVNTPCDELSPWISGDGAWLYFSSAGHETVGGYDLFRAPLSRGEVGGASNLGRPINTSYDELFPSAPANADPDTLLYYSSDQTGSRLFDVYVLHMRKRAGADRTADALPPKNVRLTGRIEDSRGRPIDSAKVSIVERDPPGWKDSTITGRNGEYQFDIQQGKTYDVTAGGDSTLYGQQRINVPFSNDSGIVRRNIVVPDTITFRVNFPFNNATDPYEFTLDEQGLPGGERWLDVIERMAGFLRSANTGIIELVGHTDPVGTDPFNLDLGRRRAEFVRRELVKRGVPSGRLVVRSEGETRPLPPVADEKEELYHARLRRVELLRRDQ